MKKNSRKPLRKAKLNRSCPKKKVGRKNPKGRIPLLWEKKNISMKRKRNPGLIDSYDIDEEVENIMRNPKRKNPKRRKNAILMVGNPMEDQEDQEEDVQENPKRRKNAILMVGNPIKRKNPVKKKRKRRKNPKRRKNAILMVGNPIPIPIIGDIFGDDWVGAGTVIGGAALALMSMPAVAGDLFQSAKNKELRINNRVALAGSIGGVALLGYYFYRKNLKELGEQNG
jgi:hypothetical protein